MDRTVEFDQAHPEDSIHPVRQALQEGLSRRSILKGIAVGGMVAALDVELAGLAGAATATSTFTLQRREDLVDLVFTGYNLTILGSPAVLSVIDDTQPAFLAVGFPTQAFGEETTQVTDTVGHSPTQRVRAAVPSRLVFKLPTGTTSIPFDVTHILNWTALTPSIPVTGQDTVTAASQPLAAPAATETSLELPWRLALSPAANSGWVHAKVPVTHSGVTELWHTRLGTNASGTVTEADASAVNIRAVWNRDASTSDNPWLWSGDNTTPSTSLDAEDRFSLVQLMANRGTRLPGTPAKVDRLMLTSMGAWTDMRGVWNTGLALVGWRHRMAAGRDTYVQVVYKGFLYPLGIKASLIKLTERVIEDLGKGPQAILRTRYYVVVRNPVKNYTAAGVTTSYEPYLGRKFPFRTVKLNTTVTPDIRPPSPINYIPQAPFDPNYPSFWVEDAFTGGFIQWSVTSTDWEGRKASFSMPMVFVFSGSSAEAPNGGGNASVPPAFSTTAMTALNTAYLSSSSGGETSGEPDVDLAGQEVAFAEVAVPHSTTHHAKQVTFGGQGLDPSGGATDPATLANLDQPAFFPHVIQAAITSAGADQVTSGPGAAPSADKLIKISQEYLSNAFTKASNPTEVYAEIVGAAQSLGLGGQQAGGVGVPNFDISGFARQLGPVGGDISNLIGGLPKFDPSDIFSLIDAKLLGAISLKDILAAFNFDPSNLGSQLGQLPKLPVEVVYPNNDKTKLPQALRTTLKYNPQVQSVTLGPFTNFFEVDPDGTKTKFLLQAVFLTPISNPGGTTYDLLGTLENFKVNLFGTDEATDFINVTFTRVRFTAKTGAKPALDVAVKGVEFGDVLQFVEDLTKYMPGLPSGPKIDLSTAGVKASYQLPIPTIALGVFSLANISLGIELNIPFDNQPMRLRFDFCTREHPFSLTISFLGGGGFFGLALGLDGIEIIEAALEFGASASVDLGVASGELHIMAGIYFKLTAATPNNKIELTGYVRAGGSMDILGIISLSIEFYLSLSYKSDSQGQGKVVGTATVTVKVHVLFFSASVSLTVEKKFGNGADPNFAALVGPSDWNTYCAAFAA